MKSNRALTVLMLVSACTFLINWKSVDEKWLKNEGKMYTVYYTTADQTRLDKYISHFDYGLFTTRQFFGKLMPRSFDIYIHPNRNSLDSSWRISWNMPEFKSECWMVASGVANRFDLVSPSVWSTEACEHNYSDEEKTNRLIAHEMVHVFHGQNNPSPDFSNTEGIDWFVEGLAAYASGQCDSARIAEVRIAMNENKLPVELDKFWTGKYRYGISGSMVMHIDKKYGREKIIALLPMTKKSEILASLKVTEQQLLSDWKSFMNSK